MSPTNQLRLAIYFFVAVTASTAQRTLTDSTPPFWSKEILQDSGGRSGVFLDINRAGVSFLNDGTLLVHQVVPSGQLSARRSPEISSAFRLRAFLLDAKSGQTIRSKELGTRFHNTSVHITTGGILVQTGGVIKLYSSDFLQARDLPLDLDPNGTYFTSVSPSGKTVAVSHYFQKQLSWMSHIDVLDASTLKVRSSWDQYPPIFTLSMSDDIFAIAKNSSLSLADFENSGPSKPVAVSSALVEGCAAGIAGPKMVSDDLMILRGCKEVLMLTAGGTWSSLDSFDGRGSKPKSAGPCVPYNAKIFGKVDVASDGLRFVAVPLPALVVKEPLFAESRACLAGLQVAVYDLIAKRRVLMVKVESLPNIDYDIALSPDGSKLAVLIDHNISVYSVPVQSQNIEGEETITKVRDTGTR